LIPVSAVAQRQQPTPEQRLDRLERQVQQVQRQVFPKGRPADTAGFSDKFSGAVSGGKAGPRETWLCFQSLRSQRRLRRRQWLSLWK